MTNNIFNVVLVGQKFVDRGRYSKTTWALKLSGKKGRKEEAKTIETTFRTLSSYPKKTFESVTTFEKVKMEKEETSTTFS